MKKKRKYTVKRQLTESQINECIRLYKQGEWIVNISKKIGFGQRKISIALKNAGVDVPVPGFRFGDKHHIWNGGRSNHPEGYTYVLIYPDDPFYDMAIKSKSKPKSRYVLEHRLVMARHLGRLLLKSETVHHIYGNKHNNAVCNLQLRQGKHGKGSVHQCVDCGSFNIRSVKLS